MSSVSQIPRCTNRKTEDEPECGLPMFRIGVETNNAWVCQFCDGGVGQYPPNYDPQNSLDSPK